MIYGVIDFSLASGGQNAPLYPPTKANFSLLFVENFTLVDSLAFSHRYPYPPSLIFHPSHIGTPGRVLYRHISAARVTVLVSWLYVSNIWRLKITYTGIGVHGNSLDYHWYIAKREQMI